MCNQCVVCTHMGSTPRGINMPPAARANQFSLSLSFSFLKKPTLKNEIGAFMQTGSGIMPVGCALVCSVEIPFRIISYPRPHLLLTTTSFRLQSIASHRACHHVHNYTPHVYCHLLHTAIRCITLYDSTYVRGIRYDTIRYVTSFVHSSMAFRPMIVHR